MAIYKGQRKRIVVVEQSIRMREYFRRAIRGLGHSALVFVNVDELLSIGKPLRDISLMCFGVPPLRQHVRGLFEEARELVGERVPAMVISSFENPRARQELGRLRRDDVHVRPGSFADVYNAMEDFMIRHDLPLAEEGLQWGGYRFYPACALVKVDDSEVWLNEQEFELALEFFHNIDRPLSAEWLRSMVARTPTRKWSSQLEDKVQQLQTRLALDAEATPPRGRVHGYRLSSIVPSPVAGRAYLIERCATP